MTKKKLFGRTVLASLFLVTTFYCYRLIKFGVERGRIALFTPSNINITFHNFYSSKKEKEIEAFAQKLLEEESFKKLGFEGMCKLLKQEFELIEQVSFKLSGFGRGTLSIYGDRPLLVVNDKFVLSRDRLYPIEEFEHFDFKKLKKVRLEGEVENIGAQLRSFILSLPSDLCSSYVVTYDSPSKIILNSSSFGIQYSIIADKNTILSDEKLSKVQEILRSKASSEPASSKRRRSFCFDIRFDNRVIETRVV